MACLRFFAGCDPFRALQVCIKGFLSAAVEGVLSEIELFVSSTGSVNIFTLTHDMMQGNATSDT